MKPKLKLDSIKILFTFCFFAFISYLLYLSTISTSSNQQKEDEKRQFNTKDTIILESQCYCRDEIKLIKLNKTIEIFTHNDNYLYNITTNEMETTLFTCSSYNSFRRGKNQKIISFSLYGTNERYYGNLRAIILQIKKLYPDWIVRIYHDNTINKLVVCKIECLKDESGILVDNTDFCQIEQLPMMDSFSKLWNVSHLHKMMWRWLPIGDHFVSVFSSRDTDSPIIQRELDSVKIWFNSDKEGHIMRGLFNLNN